MHQGILPEQIRLYTESVAATLRYVKIQKDPFPTPQRSLSRFVPIEWSSQNRLRSSEHRR